MEQAPIPRETTMTRPAEPADSPDRSDDPVEPPMAEPGKRSSGTDLGGMSASAEPGLEDWAQRSFERRDAPATGRASTGDGAAGAPDPRIDLGGKQEPGSAAGASSRSDRPASEDRATPSGAGRAAAAETTAAGAGGKPSRSNSVDDEEDEWRHEPVAPVDETNPLKSLGEAIADTLVDTDRAPTDPER
jgi:hypothetical protein